MSTTQLKELARRRIRAGYDARKAAGWKRADELMAGKGFKTPHTHRLSLGQIIGNNGSYFKLVALDEQTQTATWAGCNLDGSPRTGA